MPFAEQAPGTPDGVLGILGSVVADEQWAVGGHVASSRLMGLGTHRAHALDPVSARLDYVSAAPAPVLRAFSWQGK